MIGPRLETRLIIRDAAEAAYTRDWYILAVDTSIIQPVNQTIGHLDFPRELLRPALPAEGNLCNGSKASVHKLFICSAQCLYVVAC